MIRSTTMKNGMVAMMLLAEEKVECFFFNKKWNPTRPKINVQTTMTLHEVDT